MSMTICRQSSEFLHNVGNNRMAKRWINRPEGSNWGDYGKDDQQGRLNLLTSERVVRATREVQTGDSI